MRCTAVHSQGLAPRQRDCVPASVLTEIEGCDGRRVNRRYRGGRPGAGRIAAMAVPRGVGTGPQSRHGVHGRSDRVRRPLVVDPPAGEVRPRLGRTPLDRKVNLTHPPDGVKELRVAQADPAAWGGEADG